MSEEKKITVSLEYYADLRRENKELRAWKAKARPFLENYSFYLSMNDNIESLRLERTTLTELLGGSDEN